MNICHQKRINQTSWHLPRKSYGLIPFHYRSSTKSFAYQFHSYCSLADIYSQDGAFSGYLLLLIANMKDNILTYGLIVIIRYYTTVSLAQQILTGKNNSYQGRYIRTYTHHRHNKQKRISIVLCPVPFSSSSETKG